MTLDEIAQDDVYRNRLYQQWRHQQFCPECNHDHVWMRLVGGNTNDPQRKWKINCKNCNVFWYSPELG